jgi:hypothetical protein
MQVNKLIQYFENIANQHQEIKSFGSGDRWEIAIAGEDNYPQLWLEQVFNATATAGVVSWSIGFILSKIQKQDESDEQEILNNLFQIGIEIVEKIKADGVYIVNQDFNALSFTETFEDFCAGWRFEITLREAAGVNRCSIEDFNQACNYQVILTNNRANSFDSIITEDGVLHLASLPIDLNDGPNLATNAAALESELMAKGFETSIAVSFGTINTIQLDVVSFKSFFFANTDYSKELFSVGCDCRWVAFAKSDVNGLFNSIFIGFTNIAPPSAPLDYSETNANFATDAAQIVEEFAALGYEVTIEEVELAATYRRIKITVSNTVEGVTFAGCSISNASFKLVCN